jgi:hypothetical protein
LAHQPLDALAIDRMSLGLERHRHLSAAVERKLQVQLVDAPHQRELVVARRLRLVIHAGSRYLEQLALATN